MPNSAEDLIKKITERREEMGLTQNKLATKSHTSHTSIARIESGESVPTLSFFIAVANCLGYDLELREIKDDTNDEFKLAIADAGYKIVSDDNGVFSEDVVVLQKKRPGIRKK